MKISVVIPVYNSEKNIRKCLNSVINQSYKNWEAIVIDDGSQDNSYSILKDYMSKDDRIKVIKQENCGPGSARNKGILNAVGKYIVFLDSDDYINKSYFYDLYNIINQNDSDLIFIDVLQENTNGEIIKCEDISKYKGSSKDTILRHQMTGKLPWGGVRKVVKSSIIRENNIMYSNDVVGEEALYSFRVVYNSKKIDFLSNPSYHYINYPNSQSKKGDENPWGNVCEKVKQYLLDNNLLDKYRLTINSFALTACVISIYRIVQMYNFKESVDRVKEKIDEFELNYGFDIDIDSLDKRVTIMLPLIKFRLIYIVIFIAKLKYKITKT